MDAFLEGFRALFTLLIFVWTLEYRRSAYFNNWVRLCVAGWGVGGAITAASLFGELRAASSAQLFAFACYLMGAVAGAFALSSLRGGDWKVQGMEPYRGTDSHDGSA